MVKFLNIILNLLSTLWTQLKKWLLHCYTIFQVSPVDSYDPNSRVGHYIFIPAAGLGSTGILQRL